MTWLAFDIGTTGTKAALIDADGRTLQSAYRDYASPTHSADGGVMEQNAADWWQAVIEAVRELNRAEVEAIAITGQMQDVILIDAAGEPVRPVILYSDTRARTEGELINQRVSNLREITGNGQDASSLLAKLLWLMTNEVDTLNRATHLLTGAADFIAYRLTGNAVTDTTTASTTGLLNIESRQMLDAELFEHLGLSEIQRLLPSVQGGGTQTGTLTTEAAALLGLRAGIPVYHGPGDAGAATLGAGSGEPGQAYLYIGTSGWVAFTSGERITQAEGIFTLAHPDPRKFIYIAPLLTAGGNLEWTRDLFAQTDYGTMISEALAQSPSKLLYLPYLNGERSPFHDPDARGAFVGLHSRHTHADLTRAVLEGVIYAYRHAIDALIGDSVSQLTLTGGGTRSAGWCQLFADITGIPVSIAADANNVGVHGAVLAAQVAAGKAANYAPAGFGQTETSLQPDIADKVHYDAQYTLFREAYPALKGIFGRMKG